MRGRRVVLLIVAAPLIGCEREIIVLDRVRQDEFTQPDVLRSADVLFVVDDSKSMVEEQALLQDGILGFVRALRETDVDYRFMVVTTDTDGADAGAARGGVLDPFVPDVEAAAVEALDVGTSGDRFERGMSAAALALDGRNEGFPRADARLDVVFLSDEDDQSDVDVSAWLAATDARSGGLGFAVHGVVGDLPAGCASPGGAANAGARYHEAIAATGGLVESICAASYAAVLERVGLTAAGLQDTFPLGAIPVVETLEVEVDGVIIPGRDVDGWTWDAGQSAIVFHGRSVPRPGMDIAVRYEVLERAGG